MSIKLEVQMLTGRTVVPNGKFLASTPLASVKEAVRAASGIPVGHQRLIWQDLVLGNDVLLGDLSLPSEGATLQLVVMCPPEDEVTRAREAVEQAAAALDVLDVRSFSELKKMPRPPAGVDSVLAAVMHLRAGIDPSIALDSRGRVKDSSWKASQNMVRDPRRFLADMKEFKTVVDNGSLPSGNVEAARRIRDSMGDDFSYDAMRRKSGAIAGLAAWVLNIIVYHEVCEAIRNGLVLDEPEAPCG
jgi:hypothetical protein